MQLKFLAAWQNGYFAICGLYVIMLATFLFVRKTQFHPILGIVSRSLRLAAEDLKSFSLLLACLVSMYAVVGHSTFGADIHRFSTAYLSFETCINLVLGDMSAGKEMQTLVDPIRTIGTLFLWSYMILIFTVVLNFMLAIIVDAFIVHKSTSCESQASVLEEISVLTKDMLLHVTGVH